MGLLVLGLIWAVIVIVSMTIVAYLSKRWGRDPFAWALLAIMIGPFAIVGLVATRTADVQRQEPFEVAIQPGGASTPSARLLAACDGSVWSRAIARHIATVHPVATEVVLLAVLPREARPSPATVRLEEHEGIIEHMTGEARRELERAGIPVSVIIGYGEPGAEIVQCAREQHADMIVVGRRGGGLSKALLGSVSDYVVKHAACAVLVVEDRRPSPVDARHSMRRDTA